MSFLKKFGSAALNIGQVVTGIQPLVSEFAPIVAALAPNQKAAIATATSDLGQIAAIISNVETVGQALALKGTDKLTAATPLVAQAILQSSALAGHKIANEALFAGGSKKVADGIADILNSLHESSVKVEGKT